MPKIGMEPIRRAALVQATIEEIGAAGSLDVTVSQIARRAGMSSALAHHYFGGKEQIFLAAMRRILTTFSDEVRHELIAVTDPADRAAAIVRGSFKASCFEPHTVSAWMTFYGLAQTNPQAKRLWRIYQARLRSNLVHALKPMTPAPQEVAATMAALIDGLYIRAALLDPDAPDSASSHALRVLATLTGAKE